MAPTSSCTTHGRQGHCQSPHVPAGLSVPRPSSPLPRTLPGGFNKPFETLLPKSPRRSADSSVYNKAQALLEKLQITKDVETRDTLIALLFKMVPGNGPAGPMAEVTTTTVPPVNTFPPPPLPPLTTALPKPPAAVPTQQHPQQQQPPMSIKACEVVPPFVDIDLGQGPAPAQEMQKTGATIKLASRPASQFFVKESARATTAEEVTIYRYFLMHKGVQWRVYLRYSAAVMLSKIVLHRDLHQQQTGSSFLSGLSSSLRGFVNKFDKGLIQERQLWMAEMLQDLVDDAANWTHPLVRELLNLEGFEKALEAHLEREEEREAGLRRGERLRELQKWVWGKKYDLFPKVGRKMDEIVELKEEEEKEEEEEVVVVVGA